MRIYDKNNPPKGFYIYAYIRAYTSITATAGTPYYIGKGKGNRAVDNKHTNGSKPKELSRIVILEDNLTELGAFALERRMIRWWGRKDLKTGVLLNRTDGGEGMSNPSPETRERLSELNRLGIIGRKGKPVSLETRKKIGEGNKGKIRTEEFCKNISKRQMGRKPSALAIQRLRERNLGSTIPQEVIDKRVKTRLENNKQRPPAVHSEETKKKIGDALRGKKQKPRGPLSPEHRAAVSAAMKGLKKKPKPFDPIANKKISEALKGKPRSEETKQKIAEGHRRRAAERKAEKLAQQNALFSTLFELT